MPSGTCRKNLTQGFDVFSFGFASRSMMMFPSSSSRTSILHKLLDSSHSPPWRQPIIVGSKLRDRPRRRGRSGSPRPRWWLREEASARHTSSTTTLGTLSVRPYPRWESFPGDGNFRRSCPVWKCPRSNLLYSVWGYRLEILSIISASMFAASWVIGPDFSPKS